MLHMYGLTIAHTITFMNILLVNGKVAVYFRLIVNNTFYHYNYGFFSLEMPWQAYK